MHSQGEFVRGSAYTETPEDAFSFPKVKLWEPTTMLDQNI